jgi:hypothetical protein
MNKHAETTKREKTLNRLADFDQHDIDLYWIELPPGAEVAPLPAQPWWSSPVTWAAVWEEPNGWTVAVRMIGGELPIVSEILKLISETPIHARRLWLTPPLGFLDRVVEACGVWWTWSSHVQRRLPARRAEAVPQFARVDLIPTARALLLDLNDPRRAPHEDDRNPEQPADGETVDQDNPPALTDNEARVLRTMGTFDPSLLVGAPTISEAMEPIYRLSERTIRGIVCRFVDIGFAERPGGPRQGSRLTMRGRRMLPKIAV